MHQYKIMRFKFQHVKTNGFWLVQSVEAWSAFPSIPGVEQVVQGQCADNREIVAKSQAQCQFSPNSRAALSQGSSGCLPPLWRCTVLQLQLCLVSSLIPTLTWLHSLVWPGTCLKLLPRPLLALVTMDWLSLACAAFHLLLQSPSVLWCAAEKGYTTSLKKVLFIAQHQLVERDAVCSFPVSTPATLWVKPMLMVLSAVCQQFQQLFQEMGNCYFKHD